MKKLYQITGIEENQGIEKLITALKNGKDKKEVIEEAKKQLNPYDHKIMDVNIRKGRYVSREEKNKDGSITIKREFIEPNRLALAYQMLIVDKAKSFVFGNIPLLKANPADDKEKKVLKAVERILHDIKEGSFNRKIAKTVFSYTEVAELWYTSIFEGNKSYGFDTDSVVKAVLYDPSTGVELYPYINELGEMQAFLIIYSVTKLGKELELCDIYTSESYYRFEKDKEWKISDGFPKDNLIKKIPVVFTEQANTEWYYVQLLIERLELLLSNHAEADDKHAFPILKIKGDLNSFMEKGSGGVLKLKDGADADYISWSNAAESVKLEIENLIDLIHSITQTPNISIENVRSLGALSGTALKMLFFDAHLKVMSKREIFDEYLQRRINIIKSIIGVLEPDLKEAAENLIIEPEIVPFMIENEKENVEIALLKNGGKPLESHEKSVTNWQGYDTEDFIKIKQEEIDSNNLDFYNPVN